MRNFAGWVAPTVSVGGLSACSHRADILTPVDGKRIVSVEAVGRRNSTDVGWSVKVFGNHGIVDVYQPLAIEYLPEYRYRAYIDIRCVTPLRSQTLLYGLRTNP